MVDIYASLKIQIVNYVPYNLIVKAINILRKGSRPPILTKQEFIEFLEKTRDIEEYTSNKVPMQSDKLKIRLLNEGYLEPKCGICGTAEWEGEEVPLQLDHKNGKHDDNELSNLRVICPNCHAQTPWYRIKNEHKENTTANEDNDKPFNRQ